jgi:ABC-type amino acid transport substrate-binding protein
MFRTKIIITAILLSIIGVISAQAQNGDDVTTVRYLPPQENLGFENLYYEKLLRLALEKTIDTHGPYELVPGDEAMSQRDALKAMIKGEGVDIVHTMTDKTRERVLLPVRIPLVKGLIGVRLVMINKGDQGMFRNVRDVEDLKKYTFGQGYDWPDTEALKYNDIKVTSAQQYSDLFAMLENGVIDGFPRAVFEIYDEIMEHKDNEFAVADGFYIYYPAAMYFFVQKNTKGAKLHKRLEAGLKEAIEDGSFDKLFLALNGDHLKRAKLNQRTVIKLKNPLLTDETPLDVEEYWYIDY